MITGLPCLDFTGLWVILVWGTVHWNRFWGWRHIYLYIYNTSSEGLSTRCCLYKAVFWLVMWSFVRSPWTKTTKECPYFKVFFTQKGNYNKCHEFSKYMYPWAHKLSNINEKLCTGAPKIMPHDHAIKFGKQEAFRTCIIYIYRYMPSPPKTIPVDCGVNQARNAKNPNRPQSFMHHRGVWRSQGVRRKAQWRKALH